MDENISMASEKRQRVLATSLFDQENLVVEKAPLTFKVDKVMEIHQKPMAYIPNLIKKVADVVAEHERYT